MEHIIEKISAHLYEQLYSKSLPKFKYLYFRFDLYQYKMHWWAK